MATTVERDLLKAVLGPARHCHPRAAATMLEGLALWYQCPLSVVLCVDEAEPSSASDLYDGLGLGLDLSARRLHYDVSVAVHRRRVRRRERQISLGDFRDLRQLRIPGIGR
jgi:hypothetical protein